jgi:predicted nucleotidyltransferase
LVEDIIFTGSLANFNWSEFSDIDLHIVANFAQFDEDLLELYQELFKVKKTIFNSDFNIKIFGYDVELYVQNATEAHFSSGVYSVLYDDWDVKPEKEDSNIDTKILKSKINHWKSQIDTVVDNATEKDIDEAREYIKKFKEKTFAAKIDREEISRGVQFFGIDMKEHIELIISVLKEFKNEVQLDEIEKLEFATLSDEGDAIEGVLCSVQDIDFKSKNQDGSPKGKEKTFQIEVEGVKKHLPRNYELIKKLELVAIGTEIRIEVGGFTKLEGSKKVKNFKVLTA